MHLYLHGLNGSSRSLKAGVLREGLAPAALRAPDYPAHRPDAAIAALSAVLRDATAGGEPVTLIGSSMGGFYGQYLARHFPVRHLFLINPALDAMGLWQGLPAATMVSGQGEPWRLTAADVAALRPYSIDDPCARPVPTTLFLDAGDELIDHRIAATRYAGCARVLTWPGGNHAFAHLDEAVAMIRATTGWTASASPAQRVSADGSSCRSSAMARSCSGND